jgi:lipopolysaccharide/colanic/teichoic acid biosynthesis glycosyltransferase
MLGTIRSVSTSRFETMTAGARVSGYEIVKRAIDLTVGVVGMVVLAPVAAVITILIRRRLGSPVYFVQRRIGRHDREFLLYKFRTMTSDRDVLGELLPDDDRLTSFGRTLRATSLDELPELWNVVRGDMSLVGPRPLPTKYLPRYTTEELRRHEVRPGITGWAQVNGRNELGWDDRLAADVWYVNHRGFMTDLRVLARTVKVVLTRHGISADGVETMGELPSDRLVDR